MAAYIKSVDGTTVLGKDDLQDVRSATADLAWNWKDLGVSLGTHSSDLDAILSAYPHSPNNCLRETLALWLKQNYNIERFGKPTWRRLVEAVEDKVGGNNSALAQKIATEHPIQEQKSMDIPQDLQVMVSNYQPLQAIFAIDKGECHTREIRKDEQFSPIVTIVDTAQKQTLDCVLLLPGEKCPNVKYKTLFCYIAVQVTSVRNDDIHVSHHHPLYHMERKPNNQGKLPLIFYFHQPGTICVIQLSLHSIVDSEGVEYVHRCENLICVVQIIDRGQHGGVKMRDQHGVVRMKEPPSLRYTGPLATKRFHELEKQFTKLFLSPSFEDIQQYSKLLSNVNADIKVFALCWEALSVANRKNYRLKSYSHLLKKAWKITSKLDCENGLLLQGRVLRHWAHMEYAQGNDVKALDYTERAKQRFSNAAPSNETAFVLHTLLRLKRNELFDISKPFCPELYTSIEREYELLLEHAQYMEEYEKPVVCNFFAMKATFHLRSDIITDELPPSDYWPSPDDLKKAEECLKSVTLHIMPSQSNFYTARYYCVLCDLHIWKKQYLEAMRYLEEAREVYHQMKLKLDAMQHVLMQVNQRLKLLKRLMDDDEIDEIPTQYSVCCSML